MTGRHRLKGARGWQAHLDFILLRDAFGNAYNKLDLILNCFNDSVGSGGWRNIEHSRVGPNFAHSLHRSSARGGPVEIVCTRASLTEPKTGSPR